MKLFTLVTASVLIALAFAPVHAATNSGVRVNVPFAFVAGGRELPAGEYIIEQGTDSGLMMIHGRGAGHSTAFLTMTAATKTNDEPGVKFISVRGQKRLDRVELNDGTVRAVLKPPTK